MTGFQYAAGDAAHFPPGLDPADVWLLADESLPGRFLRRWRERPAWRQLRDVDGSWLTSRELEARTREAAHRLLASGLRPGDRLVLSAASSAALVIAYVAALRAGLVVVPLNTGYTQAEVSRIVADAQPAAAAVDDDERARWIRAATPGVRELGMDLALPAGRGDEPIDAVAGEAPALLVYTSGTTGGPKGALLTHANLLASATAVDLAWRWTPDDVLLLTLPLFHLHGLGVGLNGSLCAGSSIVLRPRFDVDDVWRTPASDDVLRRADDVPASRESGRAASCVLCACSCPAPRRCRRTVADEIERVTGQMPLERYGMTETVMLTATPTTGRASRGASGWPFPAWSCGWRRRARSRCAARTSSRDTAATRRPTREAFTADGWFRTGDLGAFDDDGYLRLVGRSKDLIISGGYNVYPREVEEALLALPGVREAAVIGRASPEWGEAVTAVIVADGPVDVDAIRAHAATQLAAYKVPKAVELVDALPRNALGKLLRGTCKRLSHNPLRASGGAGIPPGGARDSRVRHAHAACLAGAGIHQPHTRGYETASMRPGRRGRARGRAAAG